MAGGKNKSNLQHLLKQCNLDFVAVLPQAASLRLKHTKLERDKELV